MIILSFLDPNVFNVLKYIVISLTVSLAGDLLVDKLYEHSTARHLSKRGWAYPPDSSIRLRFKRGLRYRRPSTNFTILGTVLFLSIIEMAVEFSTGAESIWTEKTVTQRMAMEADNLTSVLQSSPNYISRIREALHRVENTCFNVKEMWYYPIRLNMSSLNEFNGLGQAAICMSNYSEAIDAKDDLSKQSFLASDILATNIWNASELRCGRDVGSTEETVPITQVAKDERIGALSNFSFMAVNFSKLDPVEGSEVQLTGMSDFIIKPMALYTAKYPLENGKTLECVVRMVWVKEEPEDVGERKLAEIEVCLVPIADNRSVLGLVDDIEDGDGHQLVMSVALDGVQSFHDMKAFSALPLMVGQNNGEHTYRELAVVTTMSTRMIRRINMDGFREEEFVVADENITVPTLNEWGVGLYAAGLSVIVLIRILLGRKDLEGNGNLVTARGVAEHWLRMNEAVEEVRNGEGQAVFVCEPGYGIESNVVSVRREMDVRKARDGVEDVSGSIV